MNDPMPDKPTALTPFDPRAALLAEYGMEVTAEFQRQYLTNAWVQRLVDALAAERRRYDELAAWVEVKLNDEPTERAIKRVMAEAPKFNRSQALDYIAALHRGNLICLDCGSENHTRGHAFCTADEQP